MNKIVNRVANDYEFDMPFDKKYKDVAKVLYSIRKLQEEQVIQLQEENKKLQQELDQYKNNWEELKRWLNEEIERLMKIEQSNNVIFLIGAYDEVLNKMKKIEEKNGKN